MQWASQQHQYHHHHHHHHQYNQQKQHPTVEVKLIVDSRRWKPRPSQDQAIKATVAYDGQIYYKFIPLLLCKLS